MDNIVHPSLGSTNNLNNSISNSKNNTLFSSSFGLLLYSANGDSIFYTLNGNDPNPHTHLYSDSIWLPHPVSVANPLSSIPTSASQNLISFPAWEMPNGPVKKCYALKYASFKNGIQTSPTYSQTFLPESNLNNLNVVSLITDSVGFFSDTKGIYVPGIHFNSQNPEWSGNFFQNGINWERTADFHYFNKKGEMQMNQTLEIKISGNKTRQAAQKSLALTAKSALSKNRINNNFFSQKKSYLDKSIYLKTTLGDWGKATMLKDILVHSISKDLNLKTMSHEFVEVYINGEYWGIQSIRERNSPGNLRLLSDLEGAIVDVVNPSSLVVYEGSAAEFKTIKEFIENNDLTLPSNYDYIQEVIDLENLIDYYIAETFFGNYDWPINNNKIWKAEGAYPKWRQLLFDLDAAFPTTDFNTLHHALVNIPGTFYPNPPESTVIFRKLWENIAFKKRFIQRYDELLTTTFLEENTITHLEKIADQIRPSLSDHLERWHYPHSIEEWEQNIKDLASFFRKRPCEMRNYLNEFGEENDIQVTCERNDNSNVFYTLYPNPTSNYLKIKFSTPFVEDIRVVLYDLQGKILNELQQNEHPISQIISLDLTALSSGSYFVRIQRGDKMDTEKIVKL